VSGLVFVSAFALDERESCASVMGPFPPSLLATTNLATPHDAPGAVGGPDLFIRIDQFRETFCADLPEAIAGPMAVSQRPLTAAAFTENATSADGKAYRAGIWYRRRTTQSHRNASGSWRSGQVRPQRR
jgi:hypothetical protein